jgi:formiminotetrahydrofolate cyclodeaminase
MAADTGTERTLDDYLDAVAAGTPTPGGGSVAALAGALAAALGEMVIALTVEALGDSESGAALRGAGERLASLREHLTAAMIADEAAYAAYRAAARLPREIDAQQAARADAMQTALLAATDVPLNVARAAAEIAAILEDVARDGNPRLRSDTALGALLTETALRGALLNVRGNAAHLRDDEQVRTYLADADRLEDAGRASAARAFGTVTSSANGAGSR